MHLVQTWDGVDMIEAATQPQPFGPGFPEDVAARAARMELYGTLFGTAGDDFCEFVLLDAKGNRIDAKTVAGF